MRGQRTRTFSGMHETTMENHYNFEEFTAYGSKFSTKISLGRSGGFGFSAGFYNQYKLEKSAAVKLFYDREKMAVGFKFFKEPQEEAIKLKDRDSGGHITAQSFLNKYGIDPNLYTGRYDPKEITLGNGEKMYVIELKKNGEITP
jgi:hypothetical protein